MKEELQKRIKYTTDEEEAEYDKNWAGKKFDELAGEKEDWEKKFDKLSDGQGLHYVCDGKTCNCDDIVKSFIKELLKSEKEKWQKERSGWNELKQCPQCFTMKVFTTKVCYRCTEKSKPRSTC